MKRTHSFLLALAVMAAATCAVAGGAWAAQPSDALSLALSMPPIDGNTLGWIGFGGLVVNQANLRTIQTAFNAAFRGSFELVKPHWQRVAMLVPSTTGTEEYGWLGMTTKFREWLGDRVVQNLKTHGYSIKNKTFENTVSLPREAIEDDQYGVYAPLIAQLGQDAALHPDELVFGAMLAGLSTICYDGQYFFDTDHPVGLPGKEVSVSNYGGGAANFWCLLDTTKVVKPIIFQKRRDYNFVAKTAIDDENVFQRNEFIWGSDARVNVGYGLWQLAYGSKQPLDATAYAAAYEAMMAFKADNGKPLSIKPDVLLVGPSNWQEALNVVQAERLANGATNTMRNTTEVVVCPWLT